MVPVTTDTFTAEERWEAATNGDLVLRHTNFLLGLRLADDEFADLLQKSVHIPVR